MRARMDTNEIWYIRYVANFANLHHEIPAKLQSADDWKNYVFWQRSEITYSHKSRFGKNHNPIKLDPNMVGIRKVVITESFIFILDNAGQVHKWDENEKWKLNVLDQVVDIVTNASHSAKRGTSLFVLSQSDKLFRERPQLQEFLRYKERDIRSRDISFEGKLRYWHPNGAPRSGDRVDVFRLGAGSKFRSELPEKI